MQKQPWRDLYKLEDWWAIWLGFALLASAFSGLVSAVPKMPKWALGGFSEAFVSVGLLWVPLLGVALCALFTAALYLMQGRDGLKAVPGILAVFALAALTYVVANEAVVKAYGISYAFWALVIGLLISNTLGTPEWLKPALRTEFYIKTGLVIMGAEILLNKILAFGAYGIAIAWCVTPLVIITMWQFGTRVLKMTNKHLVIIIATATAVCGVSAAIAAAAACRAKREDLTVAVGMTLIFTVLMMIVMPQAIQAMGMDEVLGGAWMGGTIDATGAVVAAGAALGENAEKAAAIVKMIQNVLIGAIAFCIAFYWVSVVEHDGSRANRPRWSELWTRFPKFILGFVGASLIASLVLIPLMGQEGVEAVIKAQTKTYRGWLFCMAFVSIGLESNFRVLANKVAGGKPVVLYLVGQSVNVVLTLLVAWLVLSGRFFAPPEGFGG